MVGSVSVPAHPPASCSTCSGAPYNTVDFSIEARLRVTGLPLECMCMRLDALSWLTSSSSPDAKTLKQHVHHMPECVRSTDMVIQDDQQGLEGTKSLQLVASAAALLEVHVDHYQQLGNSVI